MLFLTLITLLTVVAAAKSQTPFACSRAALTQAQRTRHFEQLGPALRKLHQSIRELPDGFEFEFPSDASAIQLAAEWIDGERLCCPFFDIDLRFEANSRVFWLRLTGKQEGVKPFIRSEFANWFPPNPS